MTMLVLYTLSALLNMAAILSTGSDTEICETSKCSFNLVIQQRRSMTYTDPSGFTYNVELNQEAQRLQIVANSFHQPVNEGVAHPSNASLLGTFVDPEDVITLDGTRRNIYIINGQYPGPTLEFMEGAEISVIVTNGLLTEGVTIHFHGQVFVNNTWMDGMNSVTQCPILPGHSFEYRFIAEPAGTFFYHAHFQNMRTDGIFGAFIVRKRAPVLPYHVVSVQDFYHEDATTFLLINPFSPDLSGTGETYLAPHLRDLTVDGSEVNAIDYDSSLINGRGRTHEHDRLPLATFDVVANRRYRFHVINTGAVIFYNIMIDSHKLKIVALDGQEIKPILVDSFIITPAERVDFEINTNSTIGRYWFRAEVLREGKADPVIYPNITVISDSITLGVNAILSYEGSGNAEPTSTHRECSRFDRCTIFNCPYRGTRNDKYTDCLTINDAESVETREYLQQMNGIDDADVVEHILNIGFQNGPHFNGRRFVPTTVPFSQDNSAYIKPCDEQLCVDEGCRCTHILDLPFDKTIQLVFTNYWPDATESSHHAIHVHGHTFAVMASGFAEFDPETGLSTKPNEDILCDSGLCFNPQWRDGPPKFTGKPALKDVVIVPSNGYQVVRFRSNNPGFWAIHCHQQIHHLGGMFMILHEAPGLEPPVPQNFPTCGNFSFQAESVSTPSPTESPEDDTATPVSCPWGHVPQKLKHFPYNYYYKLRINDNGKRPLYPKDEKAVISGSNGYLQLSPRQCLEIRPSEKGLLREVCVVSKFASAIKFAYYTDENVFKESIWIKNPSEKTRNCFHGDQPLIGHVTGISICPRSRRDMQLEALDIFMCSTY